MSVESESATSASGSRLATLLSPATLQERQAHVLIVGPALTGKLEMGLELLAALAEGEGAISVSTTDTPDRIRHSYDGLGGNGDGLRVIDATAGANREGIDRQYSVSTPADLTGIGIGISRATDAGPTSSPPVLIDSLSTLLMYNDLETVYRFADSVRTETRDGRGVTVSTLNTDALEETERNRLLSLATVIIEVRFGEDGQREFQIRDDSRSGEWHAAGTDQR